MSLISKSLTKNTKTCFITQNHANIHKLVNIRKLAPTNAYLTFCSLSIKTAFTPVLSKLRLSNSARRSTTRSSINFRFSPSTSILLTQSSMHAYINFLSLLPFQHTGCWSAFLWTATSIFPTVSDGLAQNHPRYMLLDRTRWRTNPFTHVNWYCLSLEPGSASKGIM